jgi:saccharopine dehydrogenase-like NADP-dependent oxidoreductase
MTTILIIGGYGNAGRVIAEGILKQTDCRVILAGRNRDAAMAAAAELNRRYEGNRADAIRLDAANPGSLPAVFEGVELVVTAAPVTGLAATIARAAASAGADMIDVGIGTSKAAELLALDGAMREADRIVIADAGFHPGLPAVLVRHVARWFDELESAEVGSVIQIDWAHLAAPISRTTSAEMMDEFRDFRTDAFRDGKWAPLPWKDASTTMDFGGAFGRRSCISMYLAEMQALQQMIPSLRRTGFYVGGFNWFSDFIMMPIMLAAAQLPKGKVTDAVASLFLWSLKAFAKPPFGTLLKVEAEGVSGGERKRAELIVSHKDGYVLPEFPWLLACSNI